MGRMEREGQSPIDALPARFWLVVVHSLAHREGRGRLARRGEREPAATLSAFGLEDRGRGVRVSGGETEH